MQNLPEFTLPRVFPPPLMKTEPHLWESHSVKDRHRGQGGLADPQEAAKLGGFMKARKNNN